MVAVDLTDKIVKVLYDLIWAKRKDIKESLENTRNLIVGNIISIDIKTCQKLKGYGGTTFIVQTQFGTTELGMIPGGMVIKFANNLEDEVNNARKLHDILVDRQKEWEEYKNQGFRLPVNIRHFPDKVYAPGVLGTFQQGQDLQVLLLELVDNPQSLSDSVEPGGFKEKLYLAGYGLARLHGFNEFKRVELSVYEPLMTHLKAYIAPNILDYWNDMLGRSQGAIQYIHGDSHLQNLLRSGNNLAWIDAMLLPDSDRLDDIGYALSYIIQKNARETLVASPKANVRDLVQYYTHICLNDWIPNILYGYQALVSLRSIYTEIIPIDFFLGAHCIIRSSLWQQDQQMLSILRELGKYFVEKAPFHVLLQKNERVS